MASDEPDQAAVPLQRCPHLYLKTTPEKGRGVFTSHPLPASTILDTSPVLPLAPAENAAHIAQTTLYHYTYNWPTPPTPPKTPSTSPSPSTTSSSKPNPTSPNSNSTPHPPTSKPQALILGLGSMFNHSTLHQNVGWTRDVAQQVIVYKTLRDVQAGEELCISYGAPGQLTFVDAEAEEVRREAEEEIRREREGGRAGGFWGDSVVIDGLMS
ncbi:hypothetical protein Q7P37_008774 [Cladosporium fusiforme]